MKKILLCAAILFLVSCSAASDPTAILLKTQEQLSQGCTFDLQFSTGQEATLRWSVGEQELCFTAPDAVEGLCYLRDGGGLSVTFEGISARISVDALPQGAAVVELYEAMDVLLAADAETLDCEIDTDGLLKVSPRNSLHRDARGAKTATENLQNAESMSRNSQRMQSVWIDTETCLPIAIKTEHWDVALALHNAL